ncbi:MULTISPECIES: ATP-dependent helicase HrpA [Pseudomonas syringae group]|uniref:Hrp pili protein HrpA n=3 Tax=Pseudomonas syringae group TaxID=136849 RepID=A0A3Q9XNH0_9PSED|nr:MULTISPECIES: ATP-dependent helicase HrpA [Pseudomonas syringae group]BBI15633.1 hrp pili protein HrpA [Pseudomonas syringae pv. coriandricola]BBI15637.1 hrp pili protein HrpA [Pseudomonas syringae pv. coriandricola]BBI15641.1 hrp pili protein HrpA [Pseudomonas syringae pv. coriandricola]BBI15645.1 hrp pili protein HrpA [Pseudomonas syringae pv. coriandricola]
MSLSSMGTKLINGGGNAMQGLSDMNSAKDRQTSLYKNTGSNDSADSVYDNLRKGDKENDKLQDISTEEGAKRREESMMAGFEAADEKLANQIVAKKIENAVVQF